MIEILVPVFAWWLILQATGLAVLPLAFRIFRALPDRGYTFTKPLGLLLVSYIFWLLVSFRFLSNTAPAIVAVIIVLALACYLYFPKPGFREFWREKQGIVLISEVLFAASLLIWGIVRAYNPEITATEKPMEIALLNATLRSEHFPPHDPWLSGYAISYYHFGYVMMALLTKLSGVTSGIGFNLGIALLFALTVLGAFGLGYNLVFRSRIGDSNETRGIIFGLLAALLVAGIGNLEGILEVFYTRGLLAPGFVDFLDIKGLGAVPLTGEWLPTDNWWWWRASRVVRDSVPDELTLELPIIRTLQIGPLDNEIIDEFPFFSLLLGDMHPHVLALPFTILAIAMAYVLFLRGETIARLDMLILSVTIGGLGFLNSWDLPTYGLVAASAYGFGRYREWRKLDRTLIADFLRFGLTLFAAAFILYLPFWISFRSQAGGALLQLLPRTSIHHYLIMFGLFIFVLLGLLVALLPQVAKEIGKANGQGNTRFLWGVVIFSVTVTGILSLLQLLHPALGLWLSIVLTLLLCLVFFTLRWDAFQEAEKKGTASLTFFLLLLAVALLLTLAVEFVYIKDVFLTRMNTVFKFYYQAWVLFAIASTYALAYLWQRIAISQGWKKGLGTAWIAGFFLLLGASLVYPFFATYSKTEGFLHQPTLEGTAFLQKYYPDEYDAIRWLDEQIQGYAVVLEATGGSYTFYGRVSAYTGLPTLLGWGGHELQWRGNYDEPGRREPLIDRLYTSTDPRELQRLLEEFDIQYVYVGFLERDKYGPAAASPERWGGLMEVVYDNPGVVILRRV